MPTLTRPMGRRSAAAGTPAATGGASGHERWLMPVAIVVAALVLVAGWMLLVSPVRSDTGAVHAQTATVTSQVDTARSQIAALKAQQADLPRYQAELKAAQAALPTTAAMPAFLRTLQDLGTATGTTVTGLTATQPAAWTGASSNGSAPAGVGTVYTITVNITVGGNAAGYVSFVKALQEVQPRAVLVDSVTVAGSPTPTMSIALTAFVAPTAGSTTNGG